MKEGDTRAMTVTVGIIGMGFMGRMHLSAYQKLSQAKVIAMADIDPDKRAGKGGDAGNLGDTNFPSDAPAFERIYQSGVELIHDADIDLVDICVPTSDHKALFLAAVNAGKNVLLEKPMAVKPADVEAIVAAGKKSKRTVMVAQCIRFWPAYVVLKDYVDTAKLGKCKSLLLRRQVPMDCGVRGIFRPPFRAAPSMICTCMTPITSISFLENRRRSVRSGRSAERPIVVSITW